MSGTGPCHALGGARHRCDSPPRAVHVTWASGRTDPYRFCDAACSELLRDAADEGEAVTVTRESP